MAVSLRWTAAETFVASVRPASTGAPIANATSSLSALSSEQRSTALSVLRSRTRRSSSRARGSARAASAASTARATSSTASSTR